MTWNHKIEPLVWQVSSDIEKSILGEIYEEIYTDEQIVGFVREAEKTQVTIAEFCRQKGFNEGTFYKWKKRFGLMQVAEVKRLRELESENARLKRLLSERLI